MYFHFSIHLFVKRSASAESSQRSDKIVSRCLSLKPIHLQALKSCSSKSRLYLDCSPHCFLHTGMVSIMSPNSTVCYQSSPLLKCTMEETADSADWKLIRNQSLELNTGSVVKLNHSCAAAGSSSCIALTLQNVTSEWAGKYNKVACTVGLFSTRTNKIKAE